MTPFKKNITIHEITNRRKERGKGNERGGGRGRGKGKGNGQWRLGEGIS
jgi:hypothetical protein